MYIALSQGQITVIDVDDKHIVDKYKGMFYAAYFKRMLSPYAVGHVVIDGKRKSIKLHRLIMCTTDSKIHVDHKNHNTLDNTKDNLRTCSSKENGMNQISMKGSSKFKGVYWNKVSKKFQTQIRCNGKSMYLGQYTNEFEAARAYNEKAAELFGDFALLNVI